MTSVSFFFFFNDTATTEIYTLSLHDALPICSLSVSVVMSTGSPKGSVDPVMVTEMPVVELWFERSEEHTSELQSRLHLVCRLLLEKKKKENIPMAGLGVFTNTSAVLTIRSCL